MKKTLTSLLRISGILILAAALWIVGNLIFGTLTDYQPETSEKLKIAGTSAFQPDSVASFVIWNIGYGGLGEEEDFWYDGGKTVKPPKKSVERYLRGIYETVVNIWEVDFFLFQEVDTLAARSHYFNELKDLTYHLSGYCQSFATNYNVRFVPVPFDNPMGKVLAGLASFSRFQPKESVRYQFPGNFSWPNRIYFLDRCFLLQRFPMKTGNELVVINTHNSAYDDGDLKKQQMDFLKNVLLEEYEKGNYVVVGGDWNQCPPGFDNSTFIPSNGDFYEQINISHDYLPSGWQWVYDETVATNRKLATPYIEGETFTTIIDFFLVSPNIEVIEVKGIDLDFAYSDHQPVLIRVRFGVEQ